MLIAFGFNSIHLLYNKLMLIFIFLLIPCSGCHPEGEMKQHHKAETSFFFCNGIAVFVQLQHLAKLVCHLLLLAPIHNVPRQEANVTTLRSIPNIDCLDLGLHPTPLLQHNNLELDQVPNCDMVPPYFVAFSGLAALTTSYTEDLPIATHSIADCRSTDENR
jgi:hypothetical protein